MLRTTVCALALAAGVPAASAGELDRESPQASTATAKAAAPRGSEGGSEMDRESPQAAHGWRWGGPRFHGGWGWGGFYPGFGFGSAFYYRPWNFYNFGYYQPFFPAYYSDYYAPVGYGWWW